MTHLYITIVHVIAIYISQVQCHCDLYSASAMSLRFIYRKCNVIAIYISQMQKTLRFIYRKCNVIAISISQMQSHYDFYIANAMSL